MRFKALLPTLCVLFFSACETTNTGGSSSNQPHDKVSAEERKTYGNLTDIKLPESSPFKIKNDSSQYPVELMILKVSTENHALYRRQFSPYITDNLFSPADKKHQQQLFTAIQADWPGIVYLNRLVMPLEINTPLTGEKSTPISYPTQSIRKKARLMAKAARENGQTQFNTEEACVGYYENILDKRYKETPLGFYINALLTDTAELSLNVRTRELIEWLNPPQSPIMPPEAEFLEISNRSIKPVRRFNEWQIMAIDEEVGGWPRKSMLTLIAIRPL